MPEQLQFAFSSLDFPGRVTLRVDEVAEKLRITPKHITDLIAEGKLQAIDARGSGASRAAYRIPIEAYRDYVTRSLTSPVERMRLLRDLPKATLRELVRELQEYLRSSN